MIMSKLLHEQLENLSEAVEECNRDNQSKILLSTETGSMDQSHWMHDFPNLDGYQSQCLAIVRHQISLTVAVVFINCILSSEICQ